MTPANPCSTALAACARISWSTATGSSPFSRTYISFSPCFIRRTGCHFRSSTCAKRGLVMVVSSAAVVHPRVLHTKDLRRFVLQERGVHDFAEEQRVIADLYALAHLA